MSSEHGEKKELWRVKIWGSWNQEGNEILGDEKKSYEWLKQVRKNEKEKLFVTREEKSLMKIGGRMLNYVVLGLFNLHQWYHEGMINYGQVDVNDKGNLELLQLAVR